MNKIEPVYYLGCGQHPVYRCRTHSDWQEVDGWMIQNKVESFLVSSGPSGYVFQVRDNHEWFLLRWA